MDGPGVRFVLFMNGCQMRCQYCHNPDTWKLKSGQKKTVAETVADIGKYARFLKYAGGLTISGGEPLMQADFVGTVMRRVKQEFGLHIALDPVDLVLLDIKLIDPARHRELTATELQPVLDAAQRLARLGKPLWIRYVLVPGWTDGFDDVERLADFVATLSTVERVEVLPFHNMAAYKWEAMAGGRYQLADTPAPTPEMEQRVRQQFFKRGLQVV